MGGAETINLTRIPEGCHYEQLLQRDFTYDTDLGPRLAIKRKYFQQRQIAQNIFEERSTALNVHIVDAVKSFVSRSLNLDGSRYFSCSDKIYGATLVLDMQISDHELTFTTIEKQLKKLKANLCVVRLKPNMMRKKSISELLEPAKQSKRVFIIIEQAEVLSRVLTESMVGQLKNRLSDDTSPTDIIMILFCLSVRVQALPFDQMNCFGRMEDITKDQGLVRSTILDDLMRSRGVEFKLGPKVLDCIYEFLMNADASITSVLYLYTYAMFEHYHGIERELDKMEQDSATLETKHQFLCDQIDFYAEFLKDYQAWPEDVSAIYGLLEGYDDLAKSEEFFNAINELKRLKPEDLLKKIQRVLDRFKDHEPQPKHLRKDVFAILHSYRDKITNNMDCKDIVLELTKDLLRHGQDLENVFKSYRCFYFNDTYLMQDRCMLSMRGSRRIINYFSLKSDYFGILFDNLIHSTGHVSANQLCYDVMEDYMKLIENERTLDGCEPENKPPPTKRKGRQSTRKAKKVNNDKSGLSRQDGEGLAKAIFVDMIDCMEHQSIIKIESRTKSKLIKRLAWPTLE